MTLDLAKKIRFLILGQALYVAMLGFEAISSFLLGLCLVVERASWMMKRENLWLGSQISNL